MNLTICCTLILLVTIRVSNSEHFSYENFRLVQVNLVSLNDLNLIKELIKSPDFDLWDSSINTANKTAVVFLSPNAFAKYSTVFDSAKISYEILQDNFEKLIQEQNESMNKRAASIVGTFARYDAITNYIEEMKAANPKLVSSYIAGATYQKRNIIVAVIRGENPRRSIWIDCGIHAREWISPSTCVYMIDKFVKDYKNNDPLTVKLLNYYEIHIMPVMNPDGYEYSHTTVRLWRKNRRLNQGNTCVGVDLNRNFGYKWMTGGSSNYPCAETYAGPSANSELETQAVQQAILKKSGQWDAYFTLHTYGQFFLTTWGYTASLPIDYLQQVEKAKIAVAAIKKVYGTVFEIGTPVEVDLGIGSGGSEDWAKGEAKIKYAHCLELRPGENSQDYKYGFLLPQDRAPKAGEETYQGIRAFINQLIVN